MMGNRISSIQFRVFLLSFLCMVAAHASREGWYMIKSDLQLEMGFSATFLGAIDTTFLFLYAMGYYGSGILADNFKPTSILAIGMCTGMVILWIVAFLGTLKVTNHSLYLILWAFEGPAQGCILTTTVNIMTYWFPPSLRGKIMGIWGTNASIGNIAGEWITAIVHEHLHLPWEVVIFVVATLLGLAGVSIKLFVNDKPPRNLLSEPLIEKHKGLSFFQAWKEPGVFLCALSYGCVKLLNYGFLMWLPFYLSTAFGMSLTVIGVLATLYDIGAVTGSIAAGYISDKIKFRSLVVEVMVLMAVPILLIFRLATIETTWVFYFLVPASGYMIGGSANIISAAVAADLSIDKETKQSRATIIGIINGTGSLGAASGQIVIGWLQHKYSWGSVFLFLISNPKSAITLIASLLMLPIVFKEKSSRRIDN